MRFSRAQGGWIFFGYLVGYLGLQIIMGMLYGLYYQLTHGEVVPQSVIMDVGIVISFISTFVVFLFFIFVLKDRFNFDLRRFNMKLLKVVFAGFALAYFVNILFSLAYMQLGIEGTSENQALLEEMIGSSPVLMLIPTAFLVPLVEEILFRGVILEFFEKRLGLIMGIIISSIFFGFMHVTDIDSMVFLPVYASLGAIFALLYIKYDRNILVPIGIHFLNNFVSVIFIILAQMGIIS